MKLSLCLFIFLMKEKILFQKKMEAAIQHCNEDKKKLNISWNVHHTLWDSIKYSEELFEEFLLYNLCLLNQGNEATFVTKNRKAINDLTLCNNNCYNQGL